MRGRVWAEAGVCVECAAWAVGVLRRHKISEE